MIPVYEPDIGDEEATAAAEAIRRGEISGTFGESIERFESEFADFCGAKHGVAVTSGTTALHIAIAAAKLEPGDEVLMSASTNIATALAAYHNQAVPVAVDSEEKTWNLDLDLIEASITERTRAIIPVHLFGMPVDMDRLNEIASKHSLLVVEDAAEAHGATCRSRQVGALGDMGCFSFYANKIITTGEGGMVVTNDADLADRLRLLRNLAFTKPRFRHEVAGFNFRMTGYQAAVGRVQLSKIESILERKKRVAAWYREQLDGFEAVRFAEEPSWASSVWWMVGITVEGPDGERDRLADHLASKGIETRTFFCPMNQQPALASQPGFRTVECPVAERLWSTGLYLPSSPSLTEETVARVTETIRTFSFS